MSGTNTEYLGKHKKFRTDRKKLAAAFAILAVIVAVIVFWWLKLVGITVTGEAFCGMQEHTHIEECYVSELICDLTEASEETPESTLPSEEADTAENTKETAGDDAAEEETAESQTSSEFHIHGEDCYEKSLTCSLVEHTHTSQCFPDKTADVETVSDWLKTIENVEITNNIPENLIAIAMSQVGYTESKLNFEYDDESNKNGYTRYGEWYGNPYGKWNTMFVSFCLHYANINNGEEFESAGAESLRLIWQDRNVYALAEEYDPQRGDVVFIDNNGDDISDSVGILLSADGTSLVVIMGDSNDKVEILSIENFDSIIGYGVTGDLSFAKDMELESETTETESSEEKDTGFEAPPLMLFNSEEPNITYINDLTTVVKAVTFKTHEGEVIDNNSTVYIGQSYVVSMEFAEKNTGGEWIQFRHDEDHHLYYQIPDNLHCEPFDEPHPITAKTENGTIEDVGTYFINEDGLLIVTFKDDPVTGECFGSKYSNVDFTIDFNATVGSTQSGTTEEVVFNDEIKINLNLDSTAEMKVTKTAEAYNGKDNTKEFTIRIEATKAVIKDLIVYDDMYKNEVANNNQHALKDTIVVTDLEGNRLEPQPTISDGRYNGNLGFTLTGFPDFAAGEGFIITYQAAINDDVLDQEVVDIWNGVYPEGKDVTGKIVSAEAEYWERVYLNKIEKDGKQTVLKNADGEAVPVIEWEIEIRKSDYDLAGTVLIDTLGYGLQYYTGQDILIKCYDQWGNSLPNKSLSWNDVEINGNSMSFPLPEGYRFVVVYYTTYEELQDGEQKHYTNTAKVTINNKEEVAGGEADVVGFVPHVTKSASGDDGKYVYFEIEANVPAVIKNWGGFFLTDLAAFWGYNENDKGYLYVENIPEDMVITAVTDSNRTITFTPYVPGGPIENTYILVAPAQGNQYHSFNVYFNTSVADGNLSTWMLNEDAKLKITYKLPFDAKTGVDWTGELQGDETLEDVLLKKYKLTNEAYLNYTDIIQTTASSTYLYTPKITKKSLVNDDGTIDYTVTFYNSIPGSEGPQGYLTSSNSVVFTDTFDEKLEYVPGSLSLTCYSPWSDSTWFNKYVYNGTVTGNTISVNSNDLVYSETNQTLDSGMLSWLRDWMPDYQTYCNNISGGRHVFTYSLRLKQQYLETTEENKYLLDNTAELIWDGDNSSGPVSDETEYKTGLIDKHAVQENNQLKFDIHINRNSLDILKGSDTLTIEDTMTENLSVYWDSIKLYYEDDDGNWIDFNETDDYSYTVTYDQSSNKLTFIIPDQLHIRIDYTTLITESGLVSVNNAVKVDGKAQVSDIVDAVFKVNDHSGGASGSLNSITLLKQDGDTDLRLPNVEFLMYGPMGDPDAVLPSGVSRSIVTEDGTSIYYIGSYRTGADGTVEIKTQYLTLGGPYALVEVSPPTGYTALEKPVLFYFYEPDPDGIIQTVTTLIAIENYSYGFVLPETGGPGTLHLTVMGLALMVSPILYSMLMKKKRRKCNR